MAAISENEIPIISNLPENSLNENPLLNVTNTTPQNAKAMPINCNGLMCSLRIKAAKSTINITLVDKRIAFIEDFIFDQLKDQRTIDYVLKDTIDLLLSDKGAKSINVTMGYDTGKGRYLERKFREQVGIAPKQLCKIIRFQSALKSLLNNREDSLTNIATDSSYYDQSHFIKDFKNFTGLNPSEFLENEEMTLSSLFYK